MKKYKIKKKCSKNVCHMIEDGVGCQKPRMARGVCSGHYNRFDRDDRLNELALPAQRNSSILGKERIKNMTINDKAEDGMCYLAEFGVPCTAKEDRRGMCKNHYAFTSRRGVREKFGYRKQNDFYVDSHFIIRKRGVAKGMCRVEQNGELCSSKLLHVNSKYGDFCHAHRDMFLRNDVTKKMIAKGVF